MVCKNGGIYGFLGAWWVLINMVPRVRLFCGEFGWARLLVVCFLDKINPSPRKKKLLLGKKCPKIPLLKPYFSWVGFGFGLMSSWVSY